MTRVIGVKFKEKGTIYYFTPGNLKPKKGNNVIVETGRGLQFGQVESDFLDLDESKLKTPLKEIIRLATPEDEKINKKNIEEITDNLIERIVELNVDMPLSTLKEKIGDKIAITKLKKQASLSEIQNAFLKSIDNYLEKIENFKF